MCNYQYARRLAHHDAGGVQLDTRYEMGHDAGDTKVCFISETSNVLMTNLKRVFMR